MFDAAILSDLEYRSKEADLFFIHYYDRNVFPDTCRFVENYQNDRKVHEKRETFQTLSDTEKANTVKQTYLLTKNPVRVSMLDSLFCAELRKRGVVARTTVSCSSNITGETLLHNRRGLEEAHIFENIAACTAIKRTTGINGEITLCGFVEITPAMIFGESCWLFLSLLAGELIVCGLSLYVAIRRRKRIPVPVDAAGPPAGPFQLDSIERTLICQDRKIVLSENTFRLFEFIWNKDAHYASYEELSDYLYGKIDAKTGKSRMSQIVKQLRNHLKDLQTAGIENVSGKGYRITLN
jgi:hypothetical protein